MNRTIILLIVIVTAITGGFASDRPAGVVRGHVVNAVTHEPLVHANVTVDGTGTGASTDTSGGFMIRGVPAGTYSITAVLLGFRPATRSDVVVSSARPAEITIELQESDVELGGVSVNAEFFRASPDVPVSTNLQSNEEIRRLPGGFEDVVRAVSILPGVAQASAGRNDLVVRGGAPSENLYIVDNLPVPNINHFGTQGASGGPLSFINLDFVGSTSFSSGGFGVKYGDRLSSILDIELRDGRQDRFGGKATISASQFGLNLEGPVTPGGSILLSARRSYLDFIFKAAGFGFVPEYWDFTAKAVYNPTQSDRITVLGLAAIDRVHLFNETADKRLDNSRILSSSQNEASTGLVWRHLFGSGYSIVTLSQNYSDFDYRQNDSLLNPVFLNSSVEVERVLRGEVVLEIPGGYELSAGVGGTVKRISSGMLLPPFRTSFGQTLAVNTSFDTSALKGSAFLQLSRTLGRLTLTAGLRADAFSLITAKPTLAPRGSLLARLSDLTALSASVGMYYQNPSEVWLAAVPSNRNLSPISVAQYIIGIDHILRSDTRLRLEVYLKRYLDYPVSLARPYLILANTGAGFGGSEDGFAAFGLDPLVSAGRGEARGIEFSAQKKLSEIPCYGLMSISYNASRFTALDGVSRPNSFDQPWIITLGGGYCFNESWEVSTKFRYASGTPYTPMNGDGTQDASQYNSARLPARHSLDIRADHRWLFGTWTLIGFCDIQNIYNHREKSIPRYNKRLQIVEYPESIGILPSIGISAEF
jgi:hypothetical protein